MSAQSPFSLRAGALALVLAALSGCTLPKSYVVLINNDDGSTGRVMVTAKEGITELQQAGTGAYIGGADNTPMVVEKQKIAQDFGIALAARPTPLKRFVLYFEASGSTLTADAQAELNRIYEALAERSTPDASIVGHTDTVGDSLQNEALGLVRAQTVAGLIMGDKLPEERTSIESHGEKNPLIVTADGVDEPRNRRVEVTVR